MLSDVETWRQFLSYPSGEFTCSKRRRKGASRPPPRQSGRRWSTGMSPRGARQLRRAIVGRARDQGMRPARFHLITLTTQGYRSDDEMIAARDNWAKSLRKYWRSWSGFLVWVKQDHQRGVLHFHAVIDDRLPRDVFDRLRNLWCHTYGMGAGGFDIQRMKSAKGTAKYLSGYLTKQKRGTTVELDVEGRLAFRPWPVSRHNGLPYVRDRIPGNTYGMSNFARAYTRPVLDFSAPLGAFPGLDGWHGVVGFAESPEHAYAVLQAVLAHNGPGQAGDGAGSASVDANASRTVQAGGR